MSSSASDLENYLIPFEEINCATENFSQQRLIGDGGFGLVYKGQLSEPWQHRTAAIKRLYQDSYQGEREFRNELEMISSFHHENIISFIGYCDQRNEMILVYDYAINGSLDRHLGDPNKMRCMTWAQRLQICIGAARGLDYLHSGLGKHDRVIHRDVKSANILLGDNLIAKICDFGLSRSGLRNLPDTQLYTSVAGTQFYMDPSYNESRILRKESDVYSFGVVMFEVLSGMLVYREGRIGDDERQFLMTFVRRYYYKPEKLIDPHIRDEVDGPSFDVFKKVAYRCISLDSKERPTMAEVVMSIEEALTIQTSMHSKIRRLIRKLDSVIPTDQRTALSEIFILASENDSSNLDIGKAGAIPRITNLLTAPDSLTQEHAMSTLYILSDTKDNLDRIMSSGAVSGIIHVLSQGSMKARENAAATLQLLSEIDENTVTIGDAGAIPPLVVLLSGGTQRGKEAATNALDHLCRYVGNAGKAVRAGAVPIFLELLTEPECCLKDEAIKILWYLSSHTEGRLAIGKAEAMPILVELIWSWSPKNKMYAISLLKKLCREDHQCLVEARELRECVFRKLHSVIPTNQRTALSRINHFAIPLITDLLTASDSQTQEHAITALYILSIFKDNRGSIMSSGAVAGIIHVLREGSMEAQEMAAVTFKFLSEVDKNRVTVGAAGAIPPLVLLLSGGTEKGKEGAIQALRYLCFYEGNIGRAVGAGVVPILMELLTQPHGYFRNEAINFLCSLSRHPKGRSAIGKADAVPVLVQFIGSGSPEIKESAVSVLLQLCSEDEKYLVEAQELGVMEKLMDLEQHGTKWGKRTAGRLKEIIATVDGPGKGLLKKISKAQRWIYNFWKS